MQIVTTTAQQTKEPIENYLPEQMVCFSHLRWDFVFQRPQQLLSRLAKTINIFYIEEPVFGPATEPHYSYSSRGYHLTVLTPQLPEGISAVEATEMQKRLFDEFMTESVLTDYAFWYYTPMALEFSRDYQPEITVFDCMDELSAFKFAPESIKVLEKELMDKADIVFTGGYSLFEAKKNKHNNIHAFPSSIDKVHFAKARLSKRNKSKTVTLGFFGVIDERFDIDLIRGIAHFRPDWEIILVGPVVKIDPETLPVAKNIRYPGQKSYAELPAAMANWDIALIPFLLNESTRFISPTKTPEYLAAGLPVISTPIRDVIHPYGESAMVSIGRTAKDFVALAETELARTDRKQWLQKVDFFLGHNSWDLTCKSMMELMNSTVKSKTVVYNTIAQS